MCETQSVRDVVFYQSGWSETIQEDPRCFLNKEVRVTLFLTSGTKRCAKKSVCFHWRCYSGCVCCQLESTSPLQRLEDSLECDSFLLKSPEDMF